MRQESAEKEDMEVPYKLPYGWCWVKLGEASGKERVADFSLRVIRRSRCHSSQEE